MADLTRNRDAAERRILLLYKGLVARLGPEDHRLTLFVAGMQRSGTNMLMAVLERSLHTDVYHEIDQRAYRRYELLRFEEIHKLIASSRRRVTVLKALCESDMIPALLEEFGPARCLWVFRNYEDVVNSAHRSFPNLKKTLYRIVNEPGDYWQSRGVLSAIRSTLERHYHESLSLDACVALFWYARNRLFFETGLDRDPRVMPIYYENMVRAPEVEFPRIFEFAGLPFSDWAVSRIHKRSVRKNPSPELPGDITNLCEQLSEEIYKVTGAGGL